MRMTYVSAVCVTAALAGQAAAGLVEDQTGASYVSGGLGGPVAQSFTPQADNLAAINLYSSGTAVLEADVTVTVFTAWDGNSGVTSLSGELGSTTNLAVPRQTQSLFVFDTPISITPGQQYFFLVELDGLVVGAARTSGDENYAGGRVIFGGGNISGADLFFTTYASDVPAPASAGLLALGGLASLRRRR